MTEQTTDSKRKVSCNCGWSSEFPASSAGLEIECPECGRLIRLPVFENSAATAPAAPVRFRAFFIASAILFLLCVVVGVTAFDEFYPNGLVVAASGLGWPLGLLAAWRGQRAQIAQNSRAE